MDVVTYHHFSTTNQVHFVQKQVIHLKPYSHQIQTHTHTPKITSRNPKVKVSKMILLSKWLIFRFHVNFLAVHSLTKTHEIHPTESLNYHLCQVHLRIYAAFANHTILHPKVILLLEIRPSPVGMYTVYNLTI